MPKKGGYTFLSVPDVGLTERPKGGIEHEEL